jgi:hypothetical protein
VPDAGPSIHSFDVKVKLGMEVDVSAELCNVKFGAALTQHV